jgi:hypothetical protein
MHSASPYRAASLQVCVILLGLGLCLPALGQTPGAIKAAGDPAPSAGADIEAPPASRAALHAPPTAALKQGAAVTAAKLNRLTVDKTFEGMGFDDNADENYGFLFIPPDPIGAAGRNLLVGVVNSMIEARNKGGALKWRSGLLDFFAPLGAALIGDFPFDPKIVYDPYEDRFVVVALQLATADPAANPSAANQSRILLAVSKTANPKGPTAADWYYHAIDSKIDDVAGPLEFWADYPGLELDEDAVYVTANLFVFPPFSGYGGVRLWIVDKGMGSGFYEDGPAGVTVHDPYAGGGLATTTMPAQVYGPGGAGPGVGTYLVSYSGLSDGVDEYVQVVRVDNPLGTPTFIQNFINIGDLEALAGGLPDAPQLGGPALIEVNDRRALDAVWRDGFLWMTTTIEPSGGPDAGQTTAYWVKLSTTSGLAALADQGGIGGEDIAPNTFTYFPAVAVNRDGAAKFGFSASAPTLYAGAYVTGRQPGDALGTVRPSEVVHEGEDYYVRTFGGTRNRWGDYSGIALDPTNEDFVWVYNEFADQRGTVDLLGQDGRWGTAWARAKFVGTKEAGKVLATAVPEAYRLDQNYPNPFNPSTSITFTLPEDARVELAVYDVLGRLVRVLSDGELAAGEHTVRFDAGTLSSGVYLLRMRTPQQTFTRTIQLAK